MTEEWLEDRTPQVPPDERFRAELHKKLEEVHRKQMTERKPGDGAPQKFNIWWAIGAVSAVLAGIAAVGTFVYLKRTRDAGLAA